MTNTPDHQAITPHEDVNGVLFVLARDLAVTFGDDLVGLYLTGSLSYGDFDRASSDIDFLAVLGQPMNGRQRAAVAEMHASVAAAYPLWRRRIEGSYVTREMLASVDPPSQPRPYVNGGEFWTPDPTYGQEWILNGYALYERGIPVIGPDPKTLFRDVGYNAYRDASIRSLHEEWAPLLRDGSYLGSSHHQAYVTLTVCRILYAARNHELASKRSASRWVKQTYGAPWRDLIEKAEGWQHGRKIDEARAVQGFIEFALAQTGRA
jgi:hypothetical protein